MTGLIPRVSIVLTNRDSSAEALGQALCDRLDNVYLSDNADPIADINYYIGAMARTAPAPTIEIGWFDALDVTQTADASVCKLAQSLDRVVTPSQALCDQLGRAGVTGSVAIPPGVDADGFKPRLRLGVIADSGHEEHDALFAYLATATDIDWQFIRPGQAVMYRALDCVLILGIGAAAALPALEALAVGTPVVAPADFGTSYGLDCIPFHLGDIDDLDRVLHAQLGHRQARHASVRERSWEAFAKAHADLFAALMPSAPQADGVHRLRPPVRLLLHGDEHKALGGPTVRVPRTARALRSLGVPAQSDVFHPTREVAEDLVHLFNVWPPDSALCALRQLKAAGKRVVFSPIYLDLSTRSFWQFELPDLISQGAETLASQTAAMRHHMQGRGRLYEAVPGYHAMIRDMLDLADHVIFLSVAERMALAEIGAIVEDERTSYVLNPVDAAIWSKSDPQLFYSKHLQGLPGPKDYVICVGRLEERKNQLMLGHVLRDLPVRPVFVGHASSPDYAAKVKEAAGPDALILGRLDPESEMLCSALTGAAVFALPSWSEGASLAALEAAACGTVMVLGDRPTEREYFGDLAEYCDPGDPESIRNAVVSALELRGDSNRADALKTLVHKKHSWESYAQSTTDAYMAALAGYVRDGVPTPPVAARTSRELVLDISPADPAGPNYSEQTDRIHADLLQAIDHQGHPVRMIFWDKIRRRFAEIPSRFSSFERALSYCSMPDSGHDLAPFYPGPECTVLTVGAAWREQPDYLRDLETLKLAMGCQLLVLVHNLAQIHSGFRYPAEQVHMVREGLLCLGAITDGFVTTAQSCRDSLTRMLASQGMEPVDISYVPMDDIIPSPGALPKTGRDVDQIAKQFSDKVFVLAVGDLDPESNFEMLHKVWAQMAETTAVSDLHLVIAGGLGQGGHNLADRIARDPQVSARIDILTDASAADLSWLYERCLFTVLPGYDPGWGSAMHESLRCGKLCLASSATDRTPDISDLVEWINPEDMHAWCEAIVLFATQDRAREIRERMISAAQLPVASRKTSSHLLEIAARPRPVRLHSPVYTGEVISAGTSARPLALRFGHGWHPAEHWGRWAGTAKASVCLQLKGGARPGLDRLVVMLQLQNHLPAGTTVPFAITCAGQTLFHTTVSGQAFCETVFASVPTSALDRDGVFELEMHLPTHLESVAQNSPLQRALGIGLSSLRVFDPELSNPLFGPPRPELWSTGEHEIRINLSDPAHRQAVAPGLGYAPAWGAGAPDGAFDLWLPLLPGAPAQTLCLSLRPVATQDTPVRAVFRLNGQLLAEHSWDNTRPARLTLMLTADKLALCGPAVLSVETDSMMSPANLQLGPTRTLAGLGLIDVSLTPYEAA